MLQSWDTSLQDTHWDIVNSVVTQQAVYVGSNGYVLRLSPENGHAEATNPLSGYGRHEVRLCVSEAELLLVVGINGYVLRLKPGNLEETWSSSLPSAGYDITSVLCDSHAIYAGSNGHVYRLKPETGKVLAHNDLPGYGSHEIRLALMGSDSLLVGMNGYIICLNSNDLKYRWHKSMPDSGATSVLAGLGCVYGACGGRVHQFGSQQGDFLNENDLSGTGTEEVRMALDGDSGRLYVGTNGYGICLRADNLTTLYSKSLPSCGYNKTDVAFIGGNSVYFACNSIVYQLDQVSNILAQRVIRDSRHETRLAGINDGSHKLIVGINGYALRLDITITPQAYDYSGKTHTVHWLPQLIDLWNWRTYDPATIDGVGMLVGAYNGRIIGIELKSNTCAPLATNSTGNSYTWVLRPDGGIIYKWWDHDDKEQYTRHSQLGSGEAVICAGEFRVDRQNYFDSVIAMVNDASGHYKPKGGDCLKYLAIRLEQIGITTDKTKWYWS